MMKKNKRYVALLRGINVGGKNKIVMAELKDALEQLSYHEVKTYLNSGNVIFSCEEGDTALLRSQIESEIQSRFALEIAVFVISQEKLKAILEQAPDWWGRDDKAIYDNLIFLLPPTTFSEIYAEIGEPKSGLEQIHPVQEAIFWSFDRREYQKTNWWAKVASTKVSGQMTIRTANTVRKIAQM